MKGSGALIGGVVLILLGGLMLAVNLEMVELRWVTLRFIFPLLFLLAGIGKLLRHFTWSEEELARRPGKTSLLGGVFWTFLGVVLAADLLGAVETLSFLGSFWPLILIAFGLGKILDFYRFAGRFQVRPSEIFGLIFILCFGLVCRVLDNAHMVLASESLGLGDLFPFAVEIDDTRHRFESTVTVPVQGAQAIVVNNLYGDVQVEPGPDDSIEVRLTKVVLRPNADEATALSDRVRLDAAPQEGQLVIGTNRQETG